MVQKFGGKWTRDKLKVFEDYLRAWLNIFHRNERARYFKKVYVDGFAGSGSIQLSDREQLYEGSARIAMGMNPGFDHYVFIELSKGNLSTLISASESYPHVKDRVEFVPGDCNKVLCEWLDNVDWRGTRALLFLDPYALQIKWSTLESIAKAKGIDLWLLFPLMAINRLLTRTREPGEGHVNILNDLFGEKEWLGEFYGTATQSSLFDDEPGKEKRVNPDAISRYFINRLKSIFHSVLEEPIILKNKKGAPMFCLMFAASNERGAPIAIKIARDIVLKHTKEL